MTNIILCGAQGRMGHQVERFAVGAYALAAKVDVAGGEGCLTSIRDFDANADVIVDFSFHTAVSELLDWAEAHQMPIVIATTGHTEAELARISEAARHIPVFKSTNFSLGVAVLTELVKMAAGALEGADIEIVETHHNKKQDAPSGTALSLAQAVQSVTGGELVFGRQGHQPRQPGEIGIHALRLGNVPGTHEVYLDTGNETITLSHQAHDRAIFAEGALKAAEFIKDQEPGMYSMPDLLASMRKGV